jgi:hypothetical protein
MGMLIERLRERQVEARREFAGRFAAFSGKSGRRRWKRLLDHLAARAPKADAAAAAHDHRPGGRRG